MHSFCHGVEGVVNDLLFGELAAAGAVHMESGILRPVFYRIKRTQTGGGALSVGNIDQPAQIRDGTEDMIGTLIEILLRNF